MDNKEPLILDVNREFLAKNTFIMPIAIGIFTFIFYIDKNIIYHLCGYYVYFIIQGFIATFILGIITYFLYNLWVLIDKTPLAIVDNDGIWFRDYGFICWADIEHIGIYSLGNTPIEVLGIRLKDINQISKQSRWPGKFRLFWTKLFKHNTHINFTNLNIPNEEVIRFAKQFMHIDDPINDSEDYDEFFEDEE